MTPETRVKKMVKEKLAPITSLYQHWPVLNGMGAPELDCNIIANGYALSIECKGPGEHMTKRQEITAAAKREAGGWVFEVDSQFDMGIVLQAITALRNDDTDTAKRMEAFNRQAKKHG